MSQDEEKDLYARLVKEDSAAQKRMLEANLRLVVNIAKKFSSQTRTLDLLDLIQEGNIGFNEAIRDFKSRKGVKFITFANLCIERQINGAVLAADRQKHKILNDSISLENTFAVKKPLIYFLADQKEKDPSNYIIELEQEAELNLIIKQLLTPLEQQVFELKLSNFSYKEIASILGKSYKSIDSTIQRIKNKLKKRLEL